MRIPVTICHGTSWRPEPKHLNARRFELYFRIAAEYGFRSVTYHHLASWRDGAALPDRPVMFDFDHPMRSTHRVIWPLMQRHGFVGTLFVNTSWMEKAGTDDRYMTWDEIAELRDAGWEIGAHMHQHFNLAYLARRDPSGALIRAQMLLGDRLLSEHAGVVPRVFAYTGTTFSLVAEAEARQRYRFARLWITGADYETDRGSLRFADLAGVAGTDEDDGGPPVAARYVTEETNPYRLPAMELQGLIYEEPAFRRYLEGALPTP